MNWILLLAGPIGISLLLGLLGLRIDELLTRGPLPSLDSFINFPELNNDKCTIVPGADACEDIVFHKNQAYMVCSNLQDRQAWFPPSGKRNSTGRRSWKEPIFRYDIGSKKMIQMELEGVDEVVTHGLAIYEFPGNQNKIHLFVVSHSKDQSVVHILSVENGSKKAKLVKTMRHKVLVAPNDITPTGPLSFYASNDHKYRTGIMRVIEERTGPWRWSSVIHCDADSGHCKTVWRKMQFANGMLYYPDLNRVVIVDTWGGDLYVFHVKPNYDLVLERKIHLNIGMDNVTPLPSGNAMIAGFPDYHAVGRRKVDPSQPVPAMALVLDKETLLVRPVFKDNKAFPMMTVGAVDPSGKVFLGGGVRTNGILRCEITDWDI